MTRVVAGGGLTRNRLLMQIYADVLGLEIEVAGASQASALGAAMLGAVAAGPAAGGHASIEDAAAAMAPAPTERYHCDPAAHAALRRALRLYGELYDHVRAPERAHAPPARAQVGRCRRATATCSRRACDTGSTCATLSPVRSSPRAERPSCCSTARSSPGRSIAGSSPPHGIVSTWAHVAAPAPVSAGVAVGVIQTFTMGADGLDGVWLRPVDRRPVAAG